MTSALNEHEAMKKALLGEGGFTQLSEDYDGNGTLYNRFRKGGVYLATQIYIPDEEEVESDKKLGIRRD